MKRWLTGLVSVALIIGLAGCGETISNKDKYTAGGAATGAVLGGIIGNNVGDGDNTALGAAIGGLVGGVAGRAAGANKDVSESRLQHLEQQASTRTVMVNNYDGSMQPVVLTKIGMNQWRGPNGEIYNNLPSEEQLKARYAR